MTPRTQTTAPAVFTLAHLSDLHLSPVAGLSLRTLNLKRGLGYVNWRGRRGAVHRPEVAAALVTDLQAQAPDHIAVTGDLTNLGLPQEHAQALIWLQGLGPPDRVSVVPGNHDIYVRMRRDPGIARWQPYMSSDGWGLAAGAAAGAFPYARRLGPLALIGLNSSYPTPAFNNTGRIGEAQIAILEGLLQRAAEDGLVRVVLLHHAPLPGLVAPRWALTDADRLAESLAREGAELVLHGHAHREIMAPLPSRSAPPQGWSVGVPSASAAIAHHADPLARYHLFRIALSPDALRIDLEIRGFPPPGGAIVELGHRTLLETARTSPPGPTQPPDPVAYARRDRQD